MKERKIRQKKREKSNIIEHQACKEFSILLNLSKVEFRYREGEDIKEHDNFHFLLIAAFSLAASILKYSLSSSTEVSSFFLVSLGVFFWVSALQDLEGPSSSTSGLENGIGGFVTI